jgi:HEPN domain-containing protein
MESTLFEIFDPVLTKIDAVLVQRGTPLSQRPFDAAVLMVRSNIFEFSTDGGKTQYVHDGTAAFAKTEWFRSLYKKVDEWYTNRYGSTLNQLDRKALTGVVLIFGTPFQLEVPYSLCRPGRPGQTVWISFPDHIEDAEIVLDWLVNPPNLKAMSPAVLKSTIADIKNVAEHLRFLHSNLLGVKADKAVDGLMHGITSHLRRAVDLILGMKDNEIQNCYWELQMSIECSFKSLIFQKKGSYPEVHSLKDLCAEANIFGMNFDPKRLAKFPGQKEVINRRYGQGASESVGRVFSAYLLTLELAKSAVSVMTRINLGEASFEIGQLPWQTERS